MNKVGSLIFVFFCIINSMGCSDASIVKNGHTENFPNTTIGKAFEASFDDPKWQVIETKKGQKIVQFSGKISQSLHDTNRAETATWIEQTDSYYDINQDVDAIMGSEEHDVDAVNKNPFFKGLNDEFGCSLIWEENHYAFGGNNQRHVECKNDDSKLQYLKKVRGRFADMRWPVGTPVEFQWAIHVDGKTFELTSLSSSAWKDLRANFILKMVYHE